MDWVLHIATVGSLAVVGFVYFGYPALLAMGAVLFPAGRIQKKAITPKVSFLISCFNEERVLPDKLENTLALDYPKDKLEIVVVSDASSDRTDEVAGAYAGRGVRLVRQDRRLGKTSALNLAMSDIGGDIVIFSDANAFYQADAVQKLIRSFNDPLVGYVVGYARYATAGEASGVTENRYWQYEASIKRLESRLHSVVGGDGAIYAIRRHLYEPLAADDINDFVNPLQIICKGYRGVYEPDAVCIEDPAGSFEKEFRRKVRIVNRSFTGLMRMREVMNPARTGIFAIMVITHKLLRWWMPAFLILAVVASFWLALRGNLRFMRLSAGMALFYVLFYLGYVLRHKANRIPWLFIPYYFVMVNVASFLGIVESMRGTIRSTWESPRSPAQRAQTASPVGFMIIHVLLAAALLYLGVLGVPLVKTSLAP